LVPAEAVEAKKAVSERACKPGSVTRASKTACARGRPFL